MRYEPSGFVMALTAAPPGEIATTDAKLTPCPFTLTRPVMLPVVPTNFCAG